MASSENTDGRSSAVDVTKLKAQYKKDNARAKSNFSRAKNKLLEQQELPSRREVQDACGRMDTCLELAIDVLINFSEFYFRNNEIQKCMWASNEMEKIDDEYRSAYEAANEYLQSRQDGRSSVTSETLNIEMLVKLNISETSTKEIAETQESLKQTEQEIRIARSNTKQPCQFANT